VPEIVELQKLTTGVKLMRRNSSKSTTSTYTFGRGKEVDSLG